MTLYMAYNHNGTTLMNQPTADRAVAQSEANEYRSATMNPSYVAECNEKGEEV